MDEISSETNSLRVVAITATNSLDFVSTVLEYYENGTLFAVVKVPRDLEAQKGIVVTQTVTPAPAFGWGRFTHRPDMSMRPAQIMFTSGTQGRAKAVVLSGANLADVTGRLNRVMGVDDSIREYIGVPVTYSFGLGRVRAVSAAGGAFYLPERFDPREIREMLEAGEINAISAVPSLWRIVLADPRVIGPAGERVRWIEIGSQYMSREEKEGMKRLFPNARIVQHYGLTEASRTTFLDITATQGDALEAVGAPVGEVEVTIGETGAIGIRGPHVALGILDHAGTLQPVKDADGWLWTSDKGALSDGSLWFLGRLDDQINLSGVKIGAEALEAEIRNLVAQQGGFAITGVPDPLRGESVLLAIAPEAEEAAPLLQAAAEVALKRNEIAQSGALKIWRVPALPVTETGKIQRNRLRDLYAEAAPSETAPQPATDAPTAALSDTEAAIARAWQKVTSASRIDRENSFYDLGGDSLSALQLGLIMEADFRRETVRASLEGRVLREVAAVEEGQSAPGDEDAVLTHLPESTVKTWALNVTRGLMVISVLISHWGPGVLERLGLDALMRFMAPIFRMGTPGFASVFGLGLGLYMMPNFAERKASVARRLRTITALVLTGLVLLGSVKLAAVALSDGTIDALEISRSFYNVLSFYVVALATAYIWLSLLARARNPILAALISAAVLWPLHWWVRDLLTMPSLHSLLELPRLLFVAHYNILRMMPVVLCGVAAGYWLSAQPVASASRILRYAGAAGIATILIAGIDILGVPTPDKFGFDLYASFLGYGFYLSVVLLCMGIAMPAVAGFGRRNRLGRVPLQVLIVIGGLALPIFVFHELVIPVKELLLIAGLPGSVALLLPLGAFLTFFGLGGRKLFRMYFQ